MSSGQDRNIALGNTIASVAACKRPVEIQASLHVGMHDRGILEALPLADEPLTASGCYETEGRLSFEMQPPGGLSWPSEWLYTTHIQTPLIRLSGLSKQSLKLAEGYGGCLHETRGMYPCEILFKNQLKMFKNPILY